MMFINCINRLLCFIRPSPMLSEGILRIFGKKQEIGNFFSHSFPVGLILTGCVPWLQITAFLVLLFHRTFSFPFTILCTPFPPFMNLGIVTVILMLALVYSPVLHVCLHVVQSFANNSFITPSLHIVISVCSLFAWWDPGWYTSYLREGKLRQIT